MNIDNESDATKICRSRKLISYMLNIKNETLMPSPIIYIVYRLNGRIEAGLFRWTRYNTITGKVEFWYHNDLDVDNPHVAVKIPIEDVLEFAIWL